MKYGKYLGTFFILLFSVLLPLLIDESLLSILVNVLLVIAAASAWSIFSGNTGHISLGHATYYGIGAYALALMAQDWHLSGGYELFLFLPLAGLVAGAFSLPLGWLALRTRRYVFMIVTIGIFFIFQLLASNLHSLTNGSSGIFLPPPTWGIDFFTFPFYYGALAVVVLTLLIAWRIRSSRFGLILRALRDDEERATGLGIRIGWYKLLAYMLSAALIGMVGALAIFFTGFISPSMAFDQTLDITIVTITFLGGAESLYGPLVGGLVLEPLQFYLNQQFGATAPGINQILFGCFLLAVIIVLPRGIVPSLRKHWSTWQASRHPLAVFPTLVPDDTAASTISSLAFPSSNVLPSVSLLGELSQKHIAISIPHRPMEQTSPLSIPAGFTPKIRPSRLVPVSSQAKVAMEERVTVSPVGQWRCPTCRKPFLLKGDLCYCSRCGYTRSLTESGQLRAFIP